MSLLFLQLPWNPEAEVYVLARKSDLQILCFFDVPKYSKLFQNNIAKSLHANACFCLLISTKMFISVFTKTPEPIWIIRKLFKIPTLLVGNSRY